MNLKNSPWYRQEWKGTIQTPTWSTVFPKCALYHFGYLAHLDVHILHTKAHSLRANNTADVLIAKESEIIFLVFH
jgi:hypothetical protein